MGDVKGGYPNPCAKCLEFGLQLLGALCLRPAATDQKQMASGVVLGEVMGDQSAKTTSCAGDQGCALRVKCGTGVDLPWVNLGAGKPRDQRLALAQRELGLLVSKTNRRPQRPLGCFGAVSVDQGEATGML